MSVFTSKKVEQYILPFIGGLLYAWGFPVKGFFHFFLFPIIGMALLLNSLSLTFESGKNLTVSLKNEILSVLAFSLGYCLFGYYWIPHTLKEFGSIPFPFNYALGVLFSLIILPHLMLFIFSHRLVRKINFKSGLLFKNLSMRNATLAIFLTILEYHTPQQFPAHMGHPWLQLAPYLGLAPIFGVPAFSFISFWLSLSIVAKVKTNQWDKWAIGTFATFLILNLAMPLHLPSDKHFHQLNIRMVQANIGNYVKINSEMGKGKALSQVLQTYGDLSTKPSTEPLDLIIWPETAFPTLLSSSLMKINQNFIPELFRKTIQKTGAELVVGGYDRAARSRKDFFETEYNTVFHFDKNQELLNAYHKRKLIPFGEGLPFGPLNKYFAKIIKNISFFARGDEFTYFKTKKNLTFISAVCYEILFSSFIRDYLNHDRYHPALFIINLTNDSWYGNTSELWQHKFLAHWRSLEFQMPLIRMTNTGISSVLYSDGSESQHLGHNESKNLDIKFKLYGRQSTPFQRLGFFLTFMLWMILMIIISLIKSFRKKGEEATN